ncbi:MAG: hypothetical protein MI920_08215 [Kiloniellales bacterium]|nr:hypothetical protein [Kiloniellales bacterium]
MKILIIIVGLLVVAGGGGGAAWWFLLREPPAEEVVVEEEEDNPPVRVFVDFDPLVMPVIRDGRVIQHLTFTIILELKTSEGRRAAFYSNLQLKDAFRSELHALYSRRIMLEHEHARLILRKRLMAVAQRVLGGDEVDGILVNIMTKREFEQQQQG